MPKTILGKWSVGLFVAFIIVVLVPMVADLTGQSGGNTIFDNLYLFGNLYLPGFLGAITGIAAFITGLIGIVKFKERSILVFIATVVGFFVLFLVGSDIVSLYQP